MQKFSLALCFILFLGTAILAQEGYPLPNDLQPITVENASQLQELTSIGGDLPRQLVWSPDGDVLAVGTSADVRLYDTSDFEKPPLIIPDQGDVYFNIDSELMINGQRWNAHTGEFIGAVDSRNFSGISIEVHHQEQEAIAALNKLDDRKLQLTLKDNYDFDGIVYSPNKDFAALILTSYEDGYSFPVIQLWNVETATFIADIPLRLEIINTVAFHAGGKLLVTAVETDAPYGNIFEDVQIWDGRTGENLSSHSFGGLPVHFSTDGELLAFMGWEGVELWSDHKLGTLAYSATSMISETRFNLHPDNKIIAKIYGPEVVIWDVSSGEIPETPQLVLTAESNVSRMWFNSDGSQIVTSTSDRVIEVWNTQTGERRLRIESPKYIFRLQFSPDGRYFGQSGIIWDIETGETILDVDSNTVLNHDWTYAAYWENGHVVIVSIETEQETILPVLPDYIGRIEAFSPDSEHAIFDGQETWMFNLRTGELVFSQPLTEAGNSFTFASNGQRFIESSYSMSTVTIRDTNNPQTPGLQLEIPNGSNEWIFSPDGRYLSQFYGFCGGEGMFAVHNVWDTVTGEVAYPGGYDACGPYTQILSSDGKTLILGVRSGVRILDFATLVEKAATTDDRELSRLVTIGIVELFPVGYQVNGVKLSPNDDYVAFHVAFHTEENERPITLHQINLYKISELSPENWNPEPDTVIPDAQNMVFSPDSQWVLTDNGLWNVLSGEKYADVASDIAAFSPDGMLLAIVVDGEVRLWDVSALTQGAESSLTHINVQGVRGLAFSPDGTILYIIRDGEISLWGVPVDE